MESNMIDYAALSYSTKNVGDEIQSIAAMQFLPRVDLFLDRDNLNNVDITKTTKLILNGWFMGQPKNWPPKSLILPLFISFHLTHKNDSLRTILSSENINYLRTYQPIGCRDYWTMNALKKHNIDSYFSGCLTLTLKKPNVPKTDKIYFVDSFVQLNENEANKIIKTISTTIPERYAENVEIINHWDTKGMSVIEDKFNKANKLLSKYASAKLVITSRLHCALPCLAFGTPVYFVDIGYLTKEDRNRFGGLYENFDIVQSFGADILQKKYVKKYCGALSITHKFFSKEIMRQIDWEKSENTNDRTADIKYNMIRNVENFINQI